MATNLFNIKYDYELPPEDRPEILAAIVTLKTKLVPRLLDLNASDRKALRKVNSGSIDFVVKTHGYMVANPQMVSPIIDVVGCGNDIDGFNELRGMGQDLENVFDMVDDTRMFLGARSFGATRAGYKGFQSAKELGQPGAELIVDDLGTQFEGQGRSAKPSVPPEDGSTPSTK